MYVIGGMTMVIMLYTVAQYGLLCKIEKSLDNVNNSLDKIVKSLGNIVKVLEEKYEEDR